MLIDFLNEVLKGEQEPIVDLTYHKNERLGDIVPDRKAIFDIYCENEKAEKSLWNYRLMAIYMISILGFAYDCSPEEKDKFRYDVKLRDKDIDRPYYDKLTFIYFEMPKFNKKLEDLESRYEKWLYPLGEIRLV